MTETDPIEVDVYWSMRSPYSYLALNRLVWLNSNYNVKMNIRPVLPVAVRSTKGGKGKAGGLFGIGVLVGIKVMFLGVTMITLGSAARALAAEAGRAA